MHRLTRTDFGQRTSTPYEAFVYDDLGNHLTQNNDGTEIAGLFNAANEQTKRDGTDVLYDKNGNLTKDDAGQVYFYDRQNLLTRVEDGASNRIASYAYDAFNRRIEKDVENGATDTITRFYYTADWRLLEETDDAGTPAVQRYYVWGNYIDELLLMRDVIGTGGSANADYFAARDHLFGVAALIDTSGSVMERYEYGAYGKPHIMDAGYGSRNTSTYGNNILFDGYYYDAEADLYHVRNRTYDPATMRWMQRDPLGQNRPGAGYQDGMSVYLYGQGKPLNYSDTYGLQASVLPPPKPRPCTECMETYKRRQLAIMKKSLGCAGTIVPGGTQIIVCAVVGASVGIITENMPIGAAAFAGCSCVATLVNLLEYSYCSDLVQQEANSAKAAFIRCASNCTP